MIIDASYSRRALSCGSLSFSCLFGREGVTADKQEGDWKTPLGTFPIRCAYYRPDRVSPPALAIPLVAIDRESGWCDDPDRPEYNKPVTLPFAGGHEKLWREDSLYDFFLVIGHNDDPAIPGKGSAIFIHCTRPGMEHTQGCVALAESDLVALAALVRPGDAVAIRE